MSENRVEKKSGIRFTPEQKKEIGFEAFMKANRDWFKKLYDDPNIFKACKTVADIANVPGK